MTPTKTLFPNKGHIHRYWGCRCGHTLSGDAIQPSARKFCIRGLQKPCVSPGRPPGAVCGVGALPRVSPGQSRGGACPASPSLHPHDGWCPEEALRHICTCGAKPTWCPAGVSSAGWGWRSISDYETGSEAEEGRSAGGAGRGPFSLGS